MSFGINLYTNSSPSNKVDKNLSLLGTATGSLRRGTSILDPVVKIGWYDDNTFIHIANYAYIEAFNRYYYITNIISVEKTMWEIHMHVDVLMSYKTTIREQNAIVARQSGQYNLYLDDGWFMAYQNPRIQTKLFSNSAPFETQEFVLIVAGS